MDPNNLPKPEFELPKPQETGGSEAVGTQTGEQDHGKMNEGRNMEMPAAAPPAPPQGGPITNAPAPPLPTSATKPASTASTTHTPPTIDDMAADDADLIEKAWVTKAKQIVEHTRNDPHLQNKEINKVKKDYIQKRYHKDIKLNDE